MSSKSDNNWLMVEWCSGGRDVVYIKSVLNPVNRELKIGEVLTVNRRGEPHGATLIERAKERDYLDRRIKETIKAAGPSPGPIPQEEPDDYSASGSSWAPSDDCASSGESDKESNTSKKMKLDQSKRQYINRKKSKKVLIPSYRAIAVIPKSMRPIPEHSKNYSRKRTHNERNTLFNKSLPDSTKRNNDNVARRITIDAHELEEISNSFNQLFNMLEDLKRPLLMNNFAENQQQRIEISIKEFPHANKVEECEVNDPYDPEEEFNRSDDNVLITNKYDSQYNASLQALDDRVKPSKLRKRETNADKQEWVPIGSGKTLIHIDQFRTVNWKSYTIATRTLLLAVFPRRILATHSLTGKRSPAFQNKPAKMCLDPKIISDVIIEITERFDVKENLVRSIITTKCADECKMSKQKNKKKISNANQENEVPKKEFKESNQIVVKQQCV